MSNEGDRRQRHEENLGVDGIDPSVGSGDGLQLTQLIKLYTYKNDFYSGQIISETDFSKGGKVCTY